MKTTLRKGHKPYLLLLLIACCLLFSAFADAQTAAPPRIILKSFLVNTTEEKYNEVHTFKPGENNIQIVYEAIDLQFSGAMHYRYRLHAEDKWQQTTNNTLTFPSLPPGNYVFEVSAKTENSNWSQAAVFSFEIAQLYYKNPWFIASAIGVGILSIIFIMLWRNKQNLKKQKQNFSTQLKINDMENQAKQAMMNPHFVFNALNSIQQYMQDNDKASANKYLSKFSRLIRLNLDLTSKKYIPLEEELEKLTLYLEIEKLRFGDKLNYDILIDTYLETDAIYIPSMVLQPFVENAIWHGIMPAEAPGKIIIHAESFQNETMLRIQISDNGIGLNASKQLKQKNTHTSMGVKLTIDRITLFCKKFNKTGQVLISDLSEADNTLHGTMVCIDIPLIYPNNLITID